MKKQFSRKKIAVLCSIAFSLTSINDTFAQNSQSTLIVSGSRFAENLNEVPANVNIITRDEIENSSSNTIPQVLSQIGGLRVTGLNSSSLNLDASVDMGGFGPTGITTVFQAPEKLPAEILSAASILGLDKKNPMEWTPEERKAYWETMKAKKTKS